MKGNSSAHWNAGDFTGTFDGNKESGARIEYTPDFQTYRFAGLFGTTNTGVIKNLSLTVLPATAKLKYTSSKEKSRYGALVNINSGTISDCDLTYTGSFSILIANAMNTQEMYTAGAVTAENTGTIERVSVACERMSVEFKSNAPSGRVDFEFGMIAGKSSGTGTVSDCGASGAFFLTRPYTYDYTQQKNYWPALRFLVYGGLVGNAEGGPVSGRSSVDASFDLVKDCSSNADITNIDAYIGGLVGMVTGDECMISGVNAGDISVLDGTGNYPAVTSCGVEVMAFGGIVGYVGSGARGWGVEYAVNTGSLKAGLVGRSAFIGGIGGYIRSAGKGIKAAVNAGEISIYGQKETFAGGLIGGLYVRFNDTSSAVVSDCLNFGKMIGNGSSAFTGGLIGVIQNTISFTATDSSPRAIVNCVNTGVGEYDNGIFASMEDEVNGFSVGAVTVGSCYTLLHPREVCPAVAQTYYNFTQTYARASNRTGVIQIPNNLTTDIARTEWLKTNLPASFVNDAAFLPVPSSMRLSALEQATPYALPIAESLRAAVYPSGYFGAGGDGSPADPFKIIGMVNMSWLELIPADGVVYYAKLTQDLGGQSSAFPDNLRNLSLDGGGLALSCSGNSDRSDLDMFASAENVTFLNTRFVWTGLDSAETSMGATAAVVAQAKNVRFENCIVDWGVRMFDADKTGGALFGADDTDCVVKNTLVLDSYAAFQRGVTGKYGVTRALPRHSKATAENLYVRVGSDSSAAHENAKQGVISFYDTAPVSASFEAGKIAVAYGADAGVFIKSEGGYSFAAAYSGKFTADETGPRTEFSIGIKRTLSFSNGGDTQTLTVFTGMPFSAAAIIRTDGYRFVEWKADGTSITSAIDMAATITFDALTAEYVPITPLTGKVYDGKRCDYGYTPPAGCTFTVGADGEFDLTSAGEQKYVLTVLTGNEARGSLSGSVTIDKAEVTVTPNSDQYKIYDAQGAGAIAYASTGLIEGNVFTGGLVIERNAAGRFGAGQYTIQIGDLSAGKNYNVILRPVTYTIRPRPITQLSWNIAGSWKENNTVTVYDKTERAISAEAVGILTGDTTDVRLVVDGPDGAAAIRDAGKYTVTASLTNPDYVSVVAPLKLTVEKLDLNERLYVPTVTHTYDGAIRTLTVYDKGTGEPLADDEVTTFFTYRGESFAGARDAGIYDTVAGFEVSGNYVPIAEKVNGKLIINPREVEVVLADQQLRYIGSELKVASRVLDYETKEEVNEYRLEAVLKYTPKAVVLPGSYTATVVELHANGMPTDNYKLQNADAILRFTVGKAEMRLTALSVGDLTYMDNQLSDLKVEPSFIGVDGRPVRTRMTIESNVTLDHAGVYDGIRLTFTPTANADYYEPFEHEISLTVRKKTVTITPRDVSVVYGAPWADIPFTPSFDVVGAGQSFTGSLTPVFTESDLIRDESGGRLRVKSYDVEIGSLDAGDNYTLVFEGGAKYTVLPRTVTVTFGGYGQLSYTGSPLTVTAEVGGLLAGDSATVSIRYYDAAGNLVTVTDGEGVVTDAVVNAGTYRARAESIDNENYRLAENAARTFVVNKMRVSGLTFPSGEFTYDGKPHSIAVSGAPKGLVIHYEKNGAVKAGVYTVTARFECGNNIEPIADMRATLTVKKRAVTGFDFSATEGLAYTGSVLTPKIPAVAPAEGDEVFAVFTGGPVRDVGEYSLTIIGVDDDNYYLDEPVPFTLNVGKRAVRLKAVRTLTKLYDGTDFIALRPSDFTAEGLLDGASLGGDWTFRLESTERADKIRLIVSGVEITGTNADFYTLVPPEIYVTMLYDTIAGNAGEVSGNFTVPAGAEFSAERLPDDAYAKAIEGIRSSYTVLAAFDVGVKTADGEAVTVGLGRYKLFTADADKVKAVYIGTESGLKRVEFSAEEGAIVFEADFNGDVILVANKSSYHTMIAIGAAVGIAAAVVAGLFALKRFTGRRKI